MLFHEEKAVWWNKILWVIVIGDLALLVWLFQKFGIHDPGGLTGIGALVVTLLACGWAALTFARYAVSFDGRMLNFGFNGCNGSVAVESIESVEIQQHVNLLPFGGIGWRFDFGGKRIGFLVGKGTALEVTPRGGKWKYTFNCDSAEELAAFLEKAGVEVKSA
ncbi:MAG: hypothetical protein HKN23_02065 [Verrucomicrobiales bacterium]|nr:hypothetical protein [Verrucomicrobiales bacterium]